MSAGEYLGVVGSSGNSTGPHLHFEVYNAILDLIDPYAGSCNSLNTESWWAVQPPYYDSALNALLTHDAAPDFPPCPGTEILHDRDVFAPGEVAYFAAYYRDQLSGQVSQYRVRDSQGTIRYSWNHSSPAPHYNASFWYWSITLPAGPPGFWSFEVTYQSVTRTHPFILTSPLAVGEDPAPALELHAARPHPLREQAVLGFALPRSGHARLAVLDAAGRRVAVLAEGWRTAGVHAARWDARDPVGKRVTPGVYFAQLHSGGEVRTRKLVVGS